MCSKFTKLTLLLFVWLTGNKEPCEKDSECNKHVQFTECKEKHCYCAVGFVTNTAYNRCQRIAGYGKPCNESIQCLHELGIGSMCDNNICVCDDNHYKKILRYNIIQKVVCAMKVNEGDLCVEHHDCYDMKPHEEPTMECEDGNCRCFEGLQFSDAMRKCVEIPRGKD